MPYFPGPARGFSTPESTPPTPTVTRYAVDNMWTHAPVADLLPGIRRIAETLPEAPSHMLWMNWGRARSGRRWSTRSRTRPGIALYAVWQDPANDQANIEWATGNMKAMEPLASGIQLADENPAVARPAS